jgi:hypothetical protein
LEDVPLQQVYKTAPPFSLTLVTTGKWERPASGPVTYRFVFYGSDASTTIQSN